MHLLYVVLLIALIGMCIAGGGRHFRQLDSATKRGGGRSFPVLGVSHESSSSDKRAGGRVFVARPNPDDVYNMMMKRIIDNDDDEQEQQYRGKRPGARPFQTDYYVKKGGGHAFNAAVNRGDEFGDISF